MDRVKRFVDRLAMVTGIGMMLGITLEPNFRFKVASAVGFIFEPLTALPIDIAILLLALVTAVITSVIQKYTMDNEEVQETQKKMKDLQSKLKEARLENDKERVDELQEEQKQMMSEFLGVQKQMMKPMFYIMAITIPIFAWIYLITTEPQYTHLFAQDGTNPIGLLIPFFGEVKFRDTLLVIPGGIFWYVLCSIPLSQFVRKVLNVRMGA
ncbi:MAG: hypothetical protein MAG715_00318 [Methanonatronarchaeales archaeon]|nr:hypothetical protein [Methanonatronarchaeales archaeon]